MKVVFLKNHGIIGKDELKDLAPEIASYLIGKGIVKKYEPASKSKKNVKKS